MRAWTAPAMRQMAIAGPPVAIRDTKTGDLVTAMPDGPARMYVCGITPYDATHIGHAATYVAFDLLRRAWRNAGLEVVYVQNVTDVDDPLLDRAAKEQVGWAELAERETELFRQDMADLRVLPPDHFVGAVESIPLAVALIERLQDTGAIYQVEDDLYFSVTADPSFGSESGYDRETMLKLFADRGGDPERGGKKDPLDALVWRGRRDGEPSWESPFGPGRPGWHIGCAAIAREYLGTAFDVQGGGRDLVFPHHEMCAGHAQVVDTSGPFARVYSHAGMVRYQGEKMSKSRGNLVFVSELRDSGVDPMAIRLTLLRHHYRSDWEWTDADLRNAVQTVQMWRQALALGSGAPSAPVFKEVLAALAEDLDAPRALAAVQGWVDATLGTGALADKSDPDAAMRMRTLLDVALGLDL